MASCKTAASTDSAPPFGCGALLRVEVVRLASPKAPASDPAAAPLEPTSPGAVPPASAARPAPISPEPPYPTSPPPDPDPGGAPSSGFLYEAAPFLVIGGLLVVVGGAVAISLAVRPAKPITEAEPAGLGKASVSAPSRGIAWAF